VDHSLNLKIPALVVDIENTLVQSPSHERTAQLVYPNRTVHNGGWTLVKNHNFGVGIFFSQSEDETEQGKVDGKLNLQCAEILYDLADEQGKLVIFVHKVKI
jgi:hypothetical protein